MSIVDAGVAHLVERHLAKVEVASSSLVTRSKPEQAVNRLLRLFHNLQDAAQRFPHGWDGVFTICAFGQFLRGLSNFVYLILRNGSEGT